MTNLGHDIVLFIVEIFGIIKCYVLSETLVAASHPYRHPTTITKPPESVKISLPPKVLGFFFPEVVGLKELLAVAFGKILNA